MLDSLFGMRKGEELKAPHHASAAATHDDYITTRDIVPTFLFLSKIKIATRKWLMAAGTLEGNKP